MGSIITSQVKFMSSLSNSTARHARLDALDTSNVSCRVETSGTWANPTLTQ